MIAFHQLPTGRSPPNGFLTHQVIAPLLKIFLGSVGPHLECFISQSLWDQEKIYAHQELAYAMVLYHVNWCCFTSRPFQSMLPFLPDPFLAFFGYVILTSVISTSLHAIKGSRKKANGSWREYILFWFGRRCRPEARLRPFRGHILSHTLRYEFCFFHAWFSLFLGTEASWVGSCVTYLHILPS